MPLVPDPPDPATLRPREFVWAADVPIHRCFDVSRDVRSFSPNTAPDALPGRFHPFRSVRSGRPVPTLYGASSWEGALSETVFHDVVPDGGEVSFDRLRGRALGAVVPARDLHLVDLMSFQGFKRLGTNRSQLIEPTGEANYLRTVRWAAALHAWPGNGSWGPADGLCWISRMDNQARAIVLFGDRVVVRKRGRRDDLAAYGTPIPIDEGKGYALVEAMATDALIKIIR